MTDISASNTVSDGSNGLYTPTTEEVRDVYQSRLIKVGENRFELIDEAQADAEFDRWLAEVKAQVWEEGYNAKWVETYFYDNPYRQGEEQ